MFNEDDDEDEDKIIYKEFTFKSINVDIRIKLLKNGDKLIKKGFYFVEEMKNLTESQVVLMRNYLNLKMN